MKTSSAKAKGRKLQQWFANLLVEKLNLDQEDIESRPMGSQGEDIILGKQAEQNCKGYEPVVVIKRNRQKPLVLVDAEHFVELCNK